MVEYKEQKVIRLRQLAKQMRLDALDMALGAGNNGAHLGPAFSCMEILAVLYGAVMKYNLSDKQWVERDRFIASKAHCVLAHYTALAGCGFFSRKQLETFEKNGTSLAGHPAFDLDLGIEYSGGSLGQALPVGIGMAIDAKQKARSNRVFILLGDGECDEGSNWEAFLAAPHFKLGNLTAIIDKNKLQYDGTTDEIMNLGDMKKKLEVFGWYVTEIDGHDISQLLDAFEDNKVDVPHMIIANTVKGKGVSFMENVREWHHSRLTKEQYDIAISEVSKEG
ncbi:MAG: transketolase [Candidatus Fimivivens sp.]|nr:transketolase [Candidatus Fimivivens sp.]